ncbi:conserved hypothetical protein [Ricinus communis]|uniref:Uncharacterized protein n=1 Tax=Ricinus communis TaxID=3988 RepID=B9T9S2_RICCO|nr:conserved hypothetical protein [Ricinus communis]
MVDAMMVIERQARGADHDQHRPAMRLADEVRVIDAVVAAIERHPVIGPGRIGRTIAVHHHAGEPGILRPALRPVAKGDQLLVAAMPILEDEVRHDEPAPRHAQARSAGKDHPARRLRGQRDRLVRLALAREAHREIAPLAIGEHDAVARRQRLRGGGIFLLIVDEGVARGCRTGRYRNHHHRQRQRSQRILPTGSDGRYEWTISRDRYAQANLNTNLLDQNWHSGSIPWQSAPRAAGEERRERHRTGADQDRGDRRLQLVREPEIGRRARRHGKDQPRQQRCRAQQRAGTARPAVDDPANPVQRRGGEARGLGTHGLAGIDRRAFEPVQDGEAAKRLEPWVGEAGYPARAEQHRSQPFDPARRAQRGTAIRLGKLERAQLERAQHDLGRHGAGHALQHRDPALEICHCNPPVRRNAI